jgi:tRNA (adenine57-N1/adenine58-N1)-methyltransferase catalytic subunit
VGTGQGSLTLHIARAIHALNGVAPETTGENGRDTRRAILHTTDISAKHSVHAEKVIQGFRHGLYARNVDFHVGPLDWFFGKMRESKKGSQDPNAASADTSNPESSTEPLADRAISEPELESSPSTPSEVGISPTTPDSEETHDLTSTFTPTTTGDDLPPFLAHAIVDTPGSHAHIPIITPHLLPAGKLVIFNPSITQIADCAELIKRLRLPLDCETVLELGQGISGGREWNVRAVMPRYDERALKSPKGNNRTVIESEGESEGESESDGLSDLEAETPAKKSKEQDFVMVCRPKVGNLVVGGGFVGVWRKRGV